MKPHGMKQEAMKQTAPDPLASLQEAFREVVPSSEHQLKREDDLVDLGVSSIAALEMAASLEVRYGVHFPEEQLAEMRTVGDFADLLEGLLSEQAPA